MPKQTRHHLTPRCHSKPHYTPRLPDVEEILYLTREKHEAWHRLFKEASLAQVIAILQRVERIKK